ncbi:MAG: hypothetical protein ACOYNN_08695 [Terrimicrobiaceae bacterium]
MPRPRDYDDAAKASNKKWYLANRERVLERMREYQRANFVPRHLKPAEIADFERERDRDYWHHVRNAGKTAIVKTVVKTIKEKPVKPAKPLKPIKEKEVSKRQLPKPYIIYEKEELPSDTFGIKHMRHDQKQKLLATCPLGFIDLTTAVPSFTCKFE